MTDFDALFKRKHEVVFIRNDWFWRILTKKHMITSIREDWFWRFLKKEHRVTPLPFAKFHFWTLRFIFVKNGRWCDVRTIYKASVSMNDGYHFRQKWALMWRFNICKVSVLMNDMFHFRQKWALVWRFHHLQDCSFDGRYVSVASRTGLDVTLQHLQSFSFDERYGSFSSKMGVEVTASPFAHLSDMIDVDALWKKITFQKGVTLWFFFKFS